MRFYFEIHERGDNLKKNDGSSTSNHAGTTHCLDPFLYSHVRCACMHAFCIYYYTGYYTDNVCMCASTTWAKCLHSQAIHAIHAATNTSRSIQATFPLLQHGFPNHFLHFIIALIIHILHQIHDPSRRIFLRR